MILTDEEHFLAELFLYSVVYNIVERAEFKFGSTVNCKQCGSAWCLLHM